MAKKVLMIPIAKKHLPTLILTETSKVMSPLELTNVIKGWNLLRMGSSSSESSRVKSIKMLWPNIT